LTTITTAAKTSVEIPNEHERKEIIIIIIPIVIKGLFNIAVNNWIKTKPFSKKLVDTRDLYDTYATCILSRVEMCDII